jgi:pimeloyl-ACP methyl ester carboxylesterase
VSESRARSWLDRGGYFSWRPEDADVESVEVFHLEAGDPKAPTLLLVHGFPTSSIDWYGVVDRLAERFHVCALDFPGYGFSDKPLGWGYSLMRDARLLGHYLTEVLGAKSATVLAHDRGDSVALILAGGHASDVAVVDIDHLLLSNANIYLPLSNLTMAQRLMLDENTAADLLDNATPELLAQGMGAATFWPPRDADDPVVAALAETFAHEHGLRVMHETIQYLVERADDEGTWLESLAASDIPTTVIWGLNDTVSPPRVASWVWNNHLMLKPGRNALYFISDAGHYLQDDRPGALVDAVLHSLDATGEEEPGAIAASPGSPLLVDRSRERMPNAPDVLRGDT